MRLLYFSNLVDLLKTAEEQLELPPDLTDVGGLLALLRRRGEPWDTLMTDAGVQVTVNRQFSRLDGALTNDDEVAPFPKRGSVP